MISVLYEDDAIIVVEKPIGLESQSCRKFEPDMVSEIRRHIHKLYPKNGEPYVGVIHRLDKPVGGVMVYAKTKTSAALLSKQVAEHKMKKKYLAVACGQLVEKQGQYVDYLLKNKEKNISKIVDKCIKSGKLAELSYSVLDVMAHPMGMLSLVDIFLKTGRHHQIRVQMAGHGTPLWGDLKYNSDTNQIGKDSKRTLALFAWHLSFIHPVSQKQMNFTSCPKEEIFLQFKYLQQWKEPN